MKFGRFVALAMVAVMVFGLAAMAQAADRDETIKPGETFPALEFSAELDAAAKKYLGLDAGAGKFTIGQVKADLVVLEMFGLYCMHCRAEAPKVGELYQKVQDAGLGEKAKFLGVGVKNTAFEVAAFRKQLKVPFPGVPDPKMAITKGLGVMLTPTFIVVKNTPGNPTVIMVKTGDVGELDAFVKFLQENVK